ncbi:MAG: sugar transporter [Elusimicrobia bacterium]|nr:MAG: sugar transporter [Elusimicrobiota bacterium]
MTKARKKLRVLALLDNPEQHPRGYDFSGFGEKSADGTIRFGDPDPFDELGHGTHVAGTVAAKGRTVEQLRQNLASALGPNFASTPNIYVSVTSLTKTPPRGSGTSRKVEAYILGEVAAPGLKKVKRGTTILQFLAESGGLTKFAAEKRIELHRTDAKTGAITSYLFNYRTPRGGNSRISGSTKLATGDVVKIPRRRLFE